MMATDSRKMGNDQRTSTKVKLYLKMSARIAEGPMRYSTRNVSMAGSCVGLRVRVAERRRQMFVIDSECFDRKRNEGQCVCHITTYVMYFPVPSLR